MRATFYLLIAASILAAVPAISIRFDATNEAKIHTMVSGGAKLPQGISLIQASIHYFPRNNPFQQTSQHTVTSIPVGKLSGKDDTILISWQNPGPLVEYTISDKLSSTPIWITYDRLDKWEKRKIPNTITPYLQSTPFIDADDTKIAETAKDIAAGSATQQEAAWRIAQWVRGNIAYNISTLTKDVSQKASWVLTTRQGVCDELSVLFIAMLRSIGIPARFVNGMVYTESTESSNNINGWGSHAWAEAWFPSTGWVPFDLTFAQFSWLDASHIRVADHPDIDESSVEFRWTGPEGVEFSPIIINGETQSTSPLKRPDIDISLTVPRPQVGPGSTIIVTAQIINPTSIWIPLTLSLRKAPGVLGDDLKAVLLRPHSNTKVPFILTTPRVTDEETYTSSIEVRTSTGQKATTSIEFGTTYPVTNAAQALEELTLLDQENNLDSIPELETICRPQSNQYHLLEQAHVICEHRNTGRESITANTCYKEQCQEFTVTPGETTINTFSFPATTNSPATFQTTVKNPIKRTQTSFAPIRVSFTPVFTLATLTCPRILPYLEQSTIQFVLNATSPVQGVTVSVEGIGLMSLPDFAGEYNITIPVTGKDVANTYESLIVYATAYLADGRQVEDFEECTLHVSQTPWWIDLWKNIFG